MRTFPLYVQELSSYNFIFSIIHHSLTYLLTHSTVQSPSWAANRFAASQETPHISRNPKVHYRTHKRPPTVSILGQPNPVHIPTSHLLEIHPNIIHKVIIECKKIKIMRLGRHLYQISMKPFSSSSCSWRVRRVSCSLILKMKLVPPSFPRSSYVSSSFWFIL